MNDMAWIQWGETPAENLLMLKTKTQDHEDLLNGNADAKIEGVVPRVNAMSAQLAAVRGFAIVLNAIIVLLLGYLTIRLETKPPQIIYQYVPAPQGQTHQKGMYEPAIPALSSSQQPPQSAADPSIESVR